MHTTVQTLCDHLSTIGRLHQASALLSWDQETYMPAGAAASRAEQLAALSEYAHSLHVSEETEQFLVSAEKAVATLDPENDEARLVQVARFDYNQSAKLPAKLVGSLSRETSRAHQQWVVARQAADFSLFAPSLQIVLDLTRQVADALGYIEHPYDALLNLYEPGMTSVRIDQLFTELKPELIRLTKQATEHSSSHSDILTRTFPIEQQKKLTVDVIKSIGFDLQRGRQDSAVHPFCTNFGRDDVRLTTRYDSNFLPMALYGSMHEAGHGLYEQGSPVAFENTPLAGGASLGVHESQSRLFENLVGRSQPFTEWLFPKLQLLFPEVLVVSTSTDYYQAINMVQPSCIRVEADEVTYNLHILLRYELERQLLEGSLQVKDLPAAWNAKMQEYLGITPVDDAQGVLQDVHWSIGSIGYFPTYTLGNILSGQLLEAINKDIPLLDSQLAQGEFSKLLEWLQIHIYNYGRLYKQEELVVKATGKPLQTAPYLNYLRHKFEKNSTD